jgi:hypothetical protein
LISILSFLKNSLRAKTDETSTAQMSTDAVSMVVVVLFVLFSGGVAYIIRPRDRRRSRRARHRPVALQAASASSDDPLFHGRAGGKAPTDRWARGDESE